MRLKIERPIAFIDIEGTGTNTVTDRIIDLAVLKMHPDGTEERHHWRVNPGRPIPREAVAIHGITDDDVAGKPLFKDVAAQIAAVLDGCDLGGFGIVRYDVPILCQEFQRIGVAFTAKDRKLADALVIFHRQEPRDLKAAVRFYLKRDFPGAHTAADDAEASRHVLEAQIDRYADVPPTVDELDLLCNPRDATWIDENGKLVWAGNEVQLSVGKYAGKTLREIVRSDPDYLKWMVKANFPEDTKSIIRKALAGKFPSRS